MSFDFFENKFGLVAFSIGKVYINKIMKLVIYLFTILMFGLFFRAGHQIHYIQTDIEAFFYQEQEIDLY